MSYPAIFLCTTCHRHYLVSVPSSHMSGFRETYLDDADVVAYALAGQYRTEVNCAECRMSGHVPRHHEEMTPKVSILTQP